MKALDRLRMRSLYLDELAEYRDFLMEELEKQENREYYNALIDVLAEIEDKVMLGDTEVLELPGIA